ncbi:Adipose-regulatory protein [Macleaya cordata]|uniref:Adipose-regulatory protein n=1 Tax=Macleaya cordata TaxID=56857 RepID=A0A200Q5N8_MACCD|nr:Adipose-regulatory protein [Macleaya cordata]
MEVSKKEEYSDSDQFLDVLDEFAFLDCNTNVESEEESVGSSKLSVLEFVEGEAREVVSKDLHTLKPSFPDGIRRRSSFRLGKKGGTSGGDSKDSNSKSPVISEITQVCEEITPRERKNEILFDLNENEKVCEVSDSFKLSSDRIISSETKQNLEKSSITSTIDNPPSGELNEFSSSFLVFVAELVIKAISFQLNLFFNFFTFPIWLLYCSFLFVTNPLRTLKIAKERIAEKFLRIWGVVFEVVSPFLSEQFKGQKSVGKLAAKFGWGFFWSVYVCMILFGFFVSGFVIGGLVMRYLVEEPIQITETLNFDYTKSSPVDLVPLMSCPSISCGVNCEEKAELGKFVGSRVIPPNQKLQLTISLTLPESDYNKKLGIFQVKVEFLSANGRVTDSSRHPSMLRYKSQLITYLETFLKSVPLLAGYSSEAQVLNLKMRGFTERYEPTSCIRVILEQRAEYRPGAGIPEIYAGSLMLQSELPLHKRIIWYWKKTIFIWISMVVFLMELMLILVCCRPIIIPRARPRDGPANNNGPQNTIAQIRGS